MDQVKFVEDSLYLVTFIKYYHHERGEAHTTYIIDYTDLLSFSETNSADPQTIHFCWINIISNLQLESPYLKAFLSDGAFAMTNSKVGIAAKLRETRV